MVQLRYFQLDMMDEASKLVHHDNKRILLQAPTGAGKTVLAGYMLKKASTRGYHSWFICHRRELVKQSSRTFEQFGIEHGIVAAGFERNTQAMVQVCGLQTLSRCHASLRTPGFVVWDEAHHIAAGSWAQILQAFPNAVHIGLSATPQRLDGTGLSDFFSEMVLGPSIRELIDGGFLSPYILYAPKPMDLSNIKQVAGDFNKKDLENALNKLSITGDALVNYKKYASGKRGIMFEVSISRSMQAVEKFNNAGINAEHVDGNTDPVLRDAAMQRFIAGTTKILSNVDLFAEGVDVPAAEVLIDNYPTHSLTKCMQRWGRVLRSSPNKKNAIILDQASNCYRHGLPDDDREWPLGGRKKRSVKDKDGVSIKTCPECFAIVRSITVVCGYCNYQFPKKERDILTVEGDLNEISREDIQREKQRVKTLQDLIALGKQRNYKRPELWARHVYRSRFAGRG